MKICIFRYERKPYNAIFDRIDLVGSFKAGKDGIGAVFVEFVESIYLHDEIAKASQTGR